MVCAARPTIDQDQGNACALFLYEKRSATDINTFGVKVEFGVEAGNLRNLQHALFDMDNLVQHRLPCGHVQTH